MPDTVVGKASVLFYLGIKVTIEGKWHFYLREENGDVQRLEDLTLTPACSHPAALCHFPSMQMIFYSDCLYINTDIQNHPLLTYLNNI